MLLGEDAAGLSATTIAHLTAAWDEEYQRFRPKLPKRLQAKAKHVLHEIMYAATREEAEQQLDGFVAEYEAKYPRRPRAWTTTASRCSRSSPCRPNTGRTCARPT